MSSNSKIHLLVVTVIAAYLIIAFGIVKDYGITFDEPENFAVGHKYLDYYLTGKLVFAEATPVINGHPNFYNDYFKDHPYRYGSVANVLSAVSCYLFFQKFNILDPISAHHIIIPILTALFLYGLFRFVRYYWGSFVGSFSVLLLITYPRFFGDSFNNIKDVPVLIFSSITAMTFANWYFRNKIRYLYLTFLSFGIAFATKVDAIFIAIILILWLSACFIIDRFRRDFFSKKIILTVTVGLLIMITAFVFFYPPLFPWQAGQGLFISKAWGYWFQVGTTRLTSWNIYPWLQIFYTTPTLVLILFLVGLFGIFTPILTTIFSRLRIKLNPIVPSVNETFDSSRTLGAIKTSDRNMMNLLLLIWVVFPVFKYCLPGSVNSDGIRKFFIFIVPFSIIASIGAIMIFNKFSEIIKFRRIYVTLFLSIAIFTPNIYALISGHPYQNTYYNSLVGGLKGAQDKNIPFSCDYWLNSFRKAGEWLEKNAQTNATYDGFPYPELMQYYIKRKDLERVSSYDIVPPNGYFVLVPRKWWPMIAYHDISKHLLKLGNCQKVYQIKRQGGVIVTIYYHP